jgi:hypothetical protein
MIPTRKTEDLLPGHRSHFTLAAPVVEVGQRRDSRSGIPAADPYVLRRNLAAGFGGPCAPEAQVKSSGLVYGG